MKPDVTIRNDSLLYRLYRLCYENNPSDTCEYRKALILILALYFPLFIFCVVGLVYCVILWIPILVNAFSRPIEMWVSNAWTTGACLMGLAVLFVILFAISKLCSKYKIIKYVLVCVFGIAFVVVLVWSMILYVTGQSVFSLGNKCEIVPQLISSLGAGAWFVVVAAVITFVIIRIFDSETYKKLRASAKEKWCAMIVVVDKDGVEVNDADDDESNEE